MPKKTRRQKIAAEIRKTRIDYQEDVIQNISPIHKELKLQYKEKIVPSALSKTQFSSPPLMPSTAVFKSDLTKSLFLTITLLLVEVAFYIGQNHFGFSIRSLFSL